MITLTHNNEKFEMKTNLNEITVKEFTKYINTVNEDTMFFEAYLNLFEILGVPESFLQVLNNDDLLNIIKEMNITLDNKSEILQDIEIDGYTYRLYEGDKFKITIRISALVEKAVKENYNNFIAVIMANLYKRIDLTEKEHTDPAHINHKIKLFESIEMINVVVLFGELFEGIVNKIQKFNS